MTFMRYQAVCLTAGCAVKSLPLSKREARRVAEIHEFTWAHHIVVRPLKKMKQEGTP